MYIIHTRHTLYVVIVIQNLLECQDLHVAQQDHQDQVNPMKNDNMHIHKSHYAP